MSDSVGRQQYEGGAPSLGPKSGSRAEGSRLVWQQVAFRRLIRRIDQGWSPVAEDRSAAEDEWGVLKLNAVKCGEFFPGEHKVLADDRGRPELEVREGDLLFTRANTPEYVGDVCVVRRAPRRLILSDLFYRVVLDRRKVAPRFVAYWFLGKRGREQIELDARGSSRSMVKISQEHLRGWRIPLPPLHAQEVIADFLDRKTAAIDALIADKQRLLELLDEKRNALIHRAVTKGLEPQVPMKDSGIPWFGEIPAHWELMPIKHLGSLSSGVGFPEAYQAVEDAELPFFKVKDLIGADSKGFLGHWEHTISRETAKELGATVLPANTIVFAKVGAALLLSRLARLVTPSCIDNNMMGFYVREERATPEFAYFAMTCVQFDLLVNPGAVPSVNASQVGAEKVALPPTMEQISIVQYLQDSLQKLDAAASSILKQVELLKEYRQALITASVTGQIDVTEKAEEAVA